MDTIGKVVIDSQAYYSADDIKSKARAFAGSARNAREMVRQRRVPSDAYIYIRKQGRNTIGSNSLSTTNQYLSVMRIGLKGKVI